jgi:hypothetical protein
VREIVIVIQDLYLGPDKAADPEGAATVAGSSPGEGEARGVQHLARFGNRAILAQGWRAWVAQWLGVPQYAGHPPASVAAVALAQAALERVVAAPPAVPADRAVWLATPLHLVAGLTSLHFDRRSILRLERAEREELAASFEETFRGSGFQLHALEGGELLLSGPVPDAPSATTEPARMLLTSVAESLPAGEGAPALRRLGAEMEMWLHEHPLNSRRAQRGAPGVAALWVWGGGLPPLSPATASGEIADAAFGSDAYVRGLWRLAGGEARPMPVDWATVIGEPRPARALAVVEVTELLHANPSWRLSDAVAEIDRRLVSPSLAALHRGDLDRLVLVANDRCLIVRAADRWRLWQRMRKLRSGLESLA